MTAKTVGGLVAVAAVTLALVAASPAAADTTPVLPEPTGDQPVGTTNLYLKDTSRPDTWHPEIPYRELMISLYYPTSSDRGPKKQFMTEAEAQAMLDEAGLPNLSAADIAATRTDAVVDARPAGKRHPLVVLSPGFKRPRAELMSLSEDLASHGYLVALVDHTYENVATTFPDGRVTGCDACGSYNLPFWAKLTQGRATDVSFVLDQLTHSKTWAGQIDPNRIGMAGHSVGGTSAIPAMIGDSRIKAGIDMDGTTDNPLTTDLDRPFMFFGRANTYTPGTGSESASWDRDWPRFTGWKRWLVVAGMEHPSFTDIGLVGEALGLKFGDTPAVRGAAITRAYVRAFFDEHLLGRHEPLMDQPSTQYPEVSFARTSTPYLPAPTGAQPVGSTAMYLKDTSRPDPWVPTVPYRELMVSLFYPTTSRGEKTRYMTPEESTALLTDSGLDVPPDWLTTMVTNSVADAKPAGHNLPLVVLSPGYTHPRATLSSLAEDLASHGYVVAVVGHTYEDAGTSFPDGHFAGCASCEVDHDEAFWQKVELGRAKDVSFVLDQLTHSKKWAGLIDKNRIGMAGHSIGGASTIPSMVADPRIKAGMDIDGSSLVPLTAPGLSRPFMFVSHQHEATRCASGHDNWERDWAQMSGWKRWIEVAGTQHASFTDVGVVADELGVDFGATTGGIRAQAITRQVVNGFFDQHLRGRPQAPDNPEVMDCQ
jgi:predicted dienelactone hydrolase